MMLNELFLEDINNLIITGEVNGIINKEALEKINTDL